MSIAFLNAIFFNPSQMSNLTILLGYMAILIVLGAIISLKTTTPSSFMLGNRSFPGWLLAFSLTGTSISSMAFLAFPARGYSLDFGLISASCIAEFLGLAFAGIFFVRFLRRTPDASIYTLLNQRFGAWASIFASVSFIIYSLFRMGVIMCLVAKSIHMISGSNTGGVILLCGIIVIFYTYMAGIEGVIWTDLIQTLFLIIAGVACFLFILNLLPDGLSSIMQSLPSAEKGVKLSITGTPLWIACLYFIISDSGFFMTDQAIAQRYLAGNSVRAARNSTFIAAIIATLTMAVFFGIGIALYALYNGSSLTELPPDIAGDTDKVFLYFLTQSIPDGLKGLIIVGILSAAMSTVDSGINSSATAFISNIYHPHIKQGRGDSSPSMDILRRASLIFGALGIIIAYFVFVSGESVLNIYWKWTPVFSTGVFGLFLLMRLSKRVGPLAGGIAAVTGSAVTAWISFTGGKDTPFAAPFHYMLNYPLGILTIVATGLALGFLFKRKPEDTQLIECDEITGEEYVDRPVNTEYHLIKQHALIKALQPNPYYQVLGAIGIVFYMLLWLKVIPLKLLPQDGLWIFLGITTSLLLAITPTPKNDTQNKLHSLFVLTLLGIGLPLIGAVGFFAHPSEPFFNYFFMATIAILGAFVEWVVLGFLVSIAACIATLIVSTTYANIGIPENWLTLTSGCLGVMTLYAMSSARRSLREREKLEGIAMLSHTIAMNTPGKGSPLSQLIASTADFLESGKLEAKTYPKESISIKECVETALKQYPFQGKAAEAIVLDVEEDFTVKGNKQLIINCLLHIIDNAAYYIHKNQASRILLTIEGTKKQIHIEDDGPGIPVRNIPYIFELFFSAGKLGPGMGLTYCRKILSLMGSTIRFVTKPESKGAKFTLHFSEKSKFSD